MMDVAESADRRFVRVAPRQAPGFELARPHLDMEVELGIDLVFDGCAPDARTQPAAEGHAPAGVRTFETAAENRAHSRVSAASWRRPFGVIR